MEIQEFRIMKRIRNSGLRYLRMHQRDQMDVREEGGAHERQHRDDDRSENDCYRGA